MLASASPRRRDLLKLVGIPFSIQIADVDEEPRAGESPDALTRRLAQAKALAVSGNGHQAQSAEASPCPEQLSHAAYRRTSDSRHDGVGRRSLAPVVLAADTVVVLDDVILNKPRDEAEATAMLASLRGRAHRVLTGVALAAGGQIAWTSVVETTVWMREYSVDEVERYVRSGSPLDKAGAYGIQDRAFRPVAWIDGCLANVVGLPLCEVRRALTTIDSERTWGPNWPPPAGSPGDGCDACARALDL